MVRIPSEYQEVEYIESTGSQYIDTGIIPTLKTKAHVIFSPTWKSSVGYFGARLDPYRFSCTTFSSQAYLGLNVSKNTWTSNRVPLTIHTIYDCELENGCSKINGVEYAETTLDDSKWSSNVGNFILSGLNASGNRDNTNAKWYLCEMWENNIPIRRLIPCYRKSSGEIGMYDTVSKQFYTNSGTGTFLKGNDVTYDNINLLESRRRILLNTPHIETVSDTIASFKTDVATKLKGCKIHFTPIQEGEGDPSPENVRPIHGWDGVKVTACGKNLAPPLSNTDFWSIKAWFDNNGVIHNNTVYSMCDYQKSLPNATYHLTSSNGVWKGIGFYDSEYKPIGFIQDTYTIKLISPNNAKYFRIYALNSAKDVQFEYGSEPTDYEPCTATTLTIPFNRTIYGGYVDLVKGEVVEDTIGYTVDNLNLKKGNPDNYEGETGIRFFANPQTVFADDAVYETLCNIIPCIYKPNNSSSVAKSITWISAYYGWGRSTIYGCLNTNLLNGDTSIENIKTYLKDNDFLLTVKLATPNAYQINPQTLKALRGMNNIWSDANGNIEVSFYTH